MNVFDMGDILREGPKPLSREEINSLLNLVSKHGFIPLMETFLLECVKENEKIFEGGNDEMKETTCTYCSHAEVCKLKQSCEEIYQKSENLIAHYNRESFKINITCSHFKANNNIFKRQGE